MMFDFLVINKLIVLFSFIFLRDNRLQSSMHTLYPLFHDANIGIFSHPTTFFCFFNDLFDFPTQVSQR